MMDLPLNGLVVLEFSQYLSGPSASLRLADLGARVIKIERPKTGDAGRKLAIKNLWVDDNSLLFHTINRNKESFTADLKDPAELEIIKKLISKADVMLHNFRPGVMQKTGLDYETVKAINPRIIYAEISGYGKEGPWKNKPGQDLLLQSMSGLAFTTGNRNQYPVPFGIAVGDIIAGSQLVQGILAALIRRQRTGRGALIEISMIESLLDFQFELLTTYFANKKQPERSAVNNGHTLLSAPYGIYKTSDSYIALAMMDIYQLADAAGCEEIKNFPKETIFSKRDEIKTILASHFATENAAYWIERLHEFDLWAMEVQDWEKMMSQEAYKSLGMEQSVHVHGKEIITTRCPVRINGERLYTDVAAPALGEHTQKIIDEFSLNG
ncbi:MAG: CoA transferase [Bacteroidetes bacterium]|nr:CoA transferase [Bacteroidota bacterium]